LRMTTEFSFGTYGPAFVDLISQQPVVTVAFVSEQLGTSPTTAGLLLGKATDAGMIEEITGKKRNRIFRHSRLLGLFSTDDTDPLMDNTGGST
jgi:hypothetical protein